jgi:hypothetical protein
VGSTRDDGRGGHRGTIAPLVRTSVVYVLFRASQWPTKTPRHGLCLLTSSVGAVPRNPESVTSMIWSVTPKINVAFVNDTMMYLHPQSHSMGSKIRILPPPQMMHGSVVCSTRATRAVDALPRCELSRPLSHIYHLPLSAIPGTATVLVPYIVR